MPAAECLQWTQEFYRIYESALLESELADHIKPQLNYETSTSIELHEFNELCDLYELCELYKLCKYYSMNPQKPVVNLTIHYPEIAQQYSIFH